jgi:hemerythrin
MKRLKWKLEWNEGMSVGIPEIDDDHKQFILLINELNRSIAERMRPTEILKRLQFIVEDTERHFEREERFLQERHYPDAEGHTRTHAQILSSLKNIMASFMPFGLEAEWIDAALAIKEILISHILNEDMKYALYLQIKK